MNDRFDIQDSTTLEKLQTSNNAELASIGRRGWIDQEQYNRIATENPMALAELNSLLEGRDHGKLVLQAIVQTQADAAALRTQIEQNSSQNSDNSVPAQPIEEITPVVTPDSSTNVDNSQSSPGNTSNPSPRKGTLLGSHALRSGSDHFFGTHIEGSEVQGETNELYYYAKLLATGMIINPNAIRNPQSSSHDHHGAAKDHASAGGHGSDHATSKGTVWKTDGASSNLIRKGESIPYWITQKMRSLTSFDDFSKAFHKAADKEIAILEKLQKTNDDKFKTYNQALEVERIAIQDLRNAVNGKGDPKTAFKEYEKARKLRITMVQGTQPSNNRTLDREKTKILQDNLKEQQIKLQEEYDREKKKGTNGDQKKIKVLEDSLNATKAYRQSPSVGNNRVAYEKAIQELDKHYPGGITRKVVPLADDQMIYDQEVKQFEEAKKVLEDADKKRTEIEKRVQGEIEKIQQGVQDGAFDKQTALTKIEKVINTGNSDLIDASRKMNVDLAHMDAKAVQKAIDGANHGKVASFYTATQEKFTRFEGSKTAKWGGRLMLGVLVVQLTSEGDAQRRNNVLKDLAWGSLPGIGAYHDWNIAFKGEDMNGDKLTGWDRTGRAITGFASLVGAGGLLRTIGKSTEWAKSARALRAGNLMTHAYGVSRIANYSYLGISLARVGYDVGAGALTDIHNN